MSENGASGTPSIRRGANHVVVGRGRIYLRGSVSRGRSSVAWVNGSDKLSKYGHRGRLLALAATDLRGEVTIRVDYKSYGKSSLTGEIDGRIYGSVPATPGTCQGVCHLLRESAPGTSIHTMFLGSFSLSDYFLVTIRHHSVSWIWRAHRIGYPIVWAYPLTLAGVISQCNFCGE
jgi:hypothetical protein